jgi:plasmid stabilization system protein ParE
MVSDGLSARDREEMIISTAVEQLAGMSRKGIDQLLVSIIRGHESVVVRMAAINAYLRRHQRDREAQSRLKKQLPTTLHPLVEPPEIGTDTTRREVDP